MIEAHAFFGETASLKPPPIGTTYGMRTIGGMAEEYAYKGTVSTAVRSAA